MRTRATAYPIWNRFVPEADSRLPMREQLVRFFRKGVADGTLQAGIRLPASRVLAAELKLSRITVSGAYEQLVAEGFLEARQGAGTYVAAHIARRPPAPHSPQPPYVPHSPNAAHPARMASAPAPSRAADLATPFAYIPAPSPLTSASPRAAAPQAPTAATAAGSQRARCLRGPDSMSMAQAAWPLTPGLPALDAFPYALWGRLDGRFWRRHPSPDLSYGDPQGLLALRVALAEYLGAARGVVCRPDNIVIAPGAQAAIAIAALALTDAGDSVWVENPGYDAAYRSLQLSGVRPVGVRVDDAGLDVDDGRQQAPEARLALVSPSHQYPLGVTMSLERRLALLQWAREANAFILEDDYDSEFRHEGAPTPALKALDGQDGRVIYIGTLSKLLAPGLRLGYLVVPDALVEVLQTVRNGTDHRVPASIQATAAEFIGNGHLGTHIRRTRALYGERRAALLAALGEAGEGVFAVTHAATGLHLLAYLPDTMDDLALASAARACRIGVTPLSAYFVAPPPGAPSRGLLMGFGNTPPEAINKAVRTLCALAGSRR
ncbi:GntR family transcriptional regulator [Azospira sp. I13]|nr:PLP-dependent aminotransferase family protein [Azospira sp. I13]GBG02786.1 GntR family transcriptional regulator [Azospira sp. I13]